jgi:hypothetical protein
MSQQEELRTQSLVVEENTGVTVPSWKLETFSKMGSRTNMADLALIVSWMEATYEPLTPSAKQRSM